MIFLSMKNPPGLWWLTLVILATQEEELRIVVQSQPGQIVLETLSQKKTHHKKRTGRVAQGKGPEFKPQYHKKKKKGIQGPERSKDFLKSTELETEEAEGKPKHLDSDSIKGYPAFVSHDGLHAEPVSL
jgi:hypothetical protein